MNAREQRSRDAVSAAVAVAREHGLRVAEPAVLADLFSVMVHLRPAPVVARISTWTSLLHSPITEWLAREIDVTTYLSAKGAPVVAPSRELPAGPHTRDGFAISFWTYLQADPDRTVTMADCSAMLVDLHAVLRTYPADLPMLVPQSDFALGLQALDDGEDLFRPEERERIHATAKDIMPFLAAPPGDLQPLHGDVHNGNLVATRDGPVWIDFEEVCRGPVEWDLALMSMFGAAEEMAAHHNPDRERLAACTKLRRLHITLSMLALREHLGDSQGWDDGIRMFAGDLIAVERRG
jgi:Phosphotransferase enzyme family